MAQEITQTKQKQGRSRTAAQASSLSRHVLTGAALGLYFGLFFRPAREPSLLVVVGFSLVGALLMALLQLRHPERRSVRRLLRYFLKAWAGCALMLIMLEGRHFFYDLGGRPLTALFTLLYGAAGGYLYARTGGRVTP